MNILELEKPSTQTINELVDIWLETNQAAHHFIPATYWQEKIPEVRVALPSARLFVVSEAGTIRGFLGLINAYIAGLFVETNYQEQGLGSQLLTFVQAQQSSLELDVYQENQAALAFYQKHRFVISATSLDENGTTQYRLTWQKSV